MKLNWTREYSYDFPEEEIDSICDLLRSNWGFDDQDIISMVSSVVNTFDDDIYYAWDHDLTMKIVDVIKLRAGGVQLSMFDD